VRSINPVTIRTATYLHMSQFLAVMIHPLSSGSASADWYIKIFRRWPQHDSLTVCNFRTLCHLPVFRLTAASLTPLLDTTKEPITAPYAIWAQTIRHSAGYTFTRRSWNFGAHLHATRQEERERENMFSGGGSGHVARDRASHGAYAGLR
jgi:hypothetical protein